MANYWKIVNSVIDMADLLIIVADARLPEESVNQELLRKIKKSEKKYLIVFNKDDLLDEEGFDRLKKWMKVEPFALSTSAKEHKNNMVLLRKINALVQGKSATVGVLGYPNTGKSSIINAVKGTKSAGVSSQAGHTKGVQILRVSQKIKLLDTPGVIPYDERNNLALQSLIAARNPNQLSDPEGLAMNLLETLTPKLQKFYKVELKKDLDETLEDIACALNLMKKGGEADTKKAAVRILQDWQKGKVKGDLN